MSEPSTALAPAACLLALTALFAAPASAQERDTTAAPEADVAGDTARAGSYFGRSYAVVAYDSTSGQLGLAAASTEFSVGSGGAYLEPGTGAVVVQGQATGAAGGRILEALRRGRSPASAVRPPAAGAPPVQAAALTPACDRAWQRAPGVGQEARSRPGRTGGVCYLALGVRLRSSASMDRLVRAFRSSTGSLTERLLETLAAMEDAARNVGGSRSAVLWVAAEEAADPVLGRRELRLQVDDHERPALALEKRLEVGRAAWLARRAGRASERGEYRNAASLAGRALDLDVSAPVAWLQRGRALLYLGRDEEAETAFQRMLELDPFLLGHLGDASGPEITVRESVIPYYPRLILRLDLYRRNYFDDLDFGPEPRPFGGEPGG